MQHAYIAVSFSDWTIIAALRSEVSCELITQWILPPWSARSCIIKKRDLYERVDGSLAIDNLALFIAKFVGIRRAADILGSWGKKYYYQSIPNRIPTKQCNAIRCSPSSALCWRSSSPWLAFVAWSCSNKYLLDRPARLVIESPRRLAVSSNVYQTQLTKWSQESSVSVLECVQIVDTGKIIDRNGIARDSSDFDTLSLWHLWCILGRLECASH